MRIRIQRRGLVPAVVVAVVGTVLLYLAATYGVAAWHDARSTVGTGVGTLPSTIENAPDTVATTDEYGPVGSVSVVFAGTSARHGLLGTVEDPWIAISATGGEYRALIAPDLPAPGAGAVVASPDGRRLAWAGGDGVVVYDAVSGSTRVLAVDGVSAVGGFSPDGTLLTAYADGLVVVDAGSGEVVATLDAGLDAPAESVTRAAWRPDGSAVDVVVGGELATLGADGTTGTQPTGLSESSYLAWSRSGDRLVSMSEESGVNRLFLSELSGNGTLGEPTPVDTSGLAIDRLLGFSGERTVAVVGLSLDSGALEQVVDVPLDGRSPSDLTGLPSPGENWVGAATLSVATDNLYTGTTEFPDQVWPWSYLARLVGCIVVAVFLLGLFVTRRPRRGWGRD